MRAQSAYMAGVTSDPNSPNRFNEESATYAVRGSETPDLDAGVAAIRNVLKTLPVRPGVYRMQDARGDVLYVGKARALKNRVANYTQPAKLSNRLRRMIAQTRSMTVVTTNNEAEALLLEAQLIKRFRPAYNVLLRDDKSFPYILLRGDHAFPRVQLHRGARRVKGDYFGPFAGAGQVRKTLNALQKLFLLRSCTDGFFNTRDRPCLLYQIRRCSAPCVDRIDAAGYDELVSDARDFLSGKSTKVQAKLGEQMQAASANLDFEQAAVIRDRLKALTFIQGSQAINAEGVGDADIFALACKQGVMGIQAFFIRGGQNWGHRAFFPAHTAEVPEDEVLSQFLMQFYEEVPPPRTVLIDRELAEGPVLAEALAERAGFRVELSRPQRGARRKLMEQAQRNAVEALDRRMAESTTQAKILRDIADLFGLAEPPDRIEVYDNSHIQGTNAVGAMIVAGPEGFRKGQYRKFNIRSAATDDDFAMMREVFTRRFSRAQEEDPDRDKGVWPDLVLIDGGRGQLNSARAVLEELGIEDVCLVGVAKGPHHGREGREVFHLLDGSERMLPVNAPALFHIQRLRDEVHRFAIGAHRDKRAKAITASPLDEVPGIGPARKKALLMHFGTARAVRGASLEDLKKAPGVSAAVAQQVYDFYHAQ
ncbi:excinuclease ABC subunit UvrC [Sphingomonas sp. MG17]|uniref:UvrABC system protein C n=1 Tax=Sphingomonas tagetis TaxID=2949092 RepID=A0A9X2KKU5_9SPHN|nr:excinuclease ABC subunit UvrC [Sphingomonas tagetis]MCP3730090.1 excinuclease ABC subunit UvrC [Sphingomonas tagetis]